MYIVVEARPYSVGVGVWACIPVCNDCSVHCMSMFTWTGYAHGCYGWHWRWRHKWHSN